MEYENIEVYDSASDNCVPIHVSKSGNWPEAILAAAKLPRVEIVVTEGWRDYGTVVYSDDPDVMSGRWWADIASCALLWRA